MEARPKPKFEDIVEDFEVYGIELDSSEEIVTKCLNLCETYDITSEQLAVSWLGFAASNTYDDITLERLDSFQKELLKKKKIIIKDSISPQKDEYVAPKELLSTDDDDLLATYGASPATRKTSGLQETPKRCNAKRSFEFSQHVEDFKSTPLAPSLSQSPATQNSQKYSQRTNAGTVVSSFGTSLESVKWKADLSFSPEVNVLSCGNDKPLSSPYNFMFEKLRDSAEILDDIIYNVGSQLRELLNLDETSHLQTLNNETAWCVGRIICDSVGRLNAASVMLEGDRETSSGTSVRLDLSKLPSYSLFPGQIVAVKGTNTTGECLIADEVVCGKVLPIPKTNLSMVEDGIQIRIACGPYTSLDNLLYEPLLDLLENVVKNPPNILFLLGPLVDSTHPSLEDPLLSDSYDSILERCIENIDSALRSTMTQIYIVCSERDICCHSIYPTPPAFLSEQLNVNSKIKLLPDPSLLDIEGLLIGMTTIDYPMLISREEINFFPQGGDRLARLSKHMLLQQSFYPVYPPPEGMAINTEQADFHTRLPFTPHVMVTPSDLKGYIKNVDGCIFLNPERLTKGRAGGSHCRLHVKPLSDKLDFNIEILKI